MSQYIFKQFVEKYGRLPTERDPDYLELLRMSKYRILNVPDTQPGKCANCGAAKSDGREYVDIGLQIDWYGALFFCSLCLKDIALSVGLFEELQNQLKEAKEKLIKINSLHAVGTQLQDTVLHTFEEVKSYFANLHSLGNDSPVSSNTSVGTNKTTVEQGIAEVKPRVTKSNSSGGSKGVPSLADLLDT